MTASFDLLISSGTAQQFVALARAVSDVLQESGVESRILVDRLPEDEDNVVLVVAPHDVYRHLPFDEEGLERSLARTILVCCERPTAGSWRGVLPYAARAGAVFDVSEAGVAALEGQRIPARRFRLGYHASFDRWNGEEHERPIDVAFIGSASQRRMETLAAAAHYLSDYQVDLRITEDITGEAQRRLDAVTPDDRWSLLARSKLILNLHRDEGLSFEWLRGIAAICNGCVFVTEQSIGAAPLEAGVHFVSGQRAELPDLAHELLGDPGRLAEIRDTAYRWVREEAPLSAAVGVVVEAAESLPGATPRAARPDLPAFERTAATGSPATTEPDVAAMLGQATALISRQSVVMKRLFFDLRLLRRQVAALEQSINGADAKRVVVTKTPAVEATEPEVTVLVTVYNYEGYVREAIESALASEGVRVEVVVVDDASIDRSVDVVESLIRDRPDAPITLLHQAVNTGVQRARNLAFGHARAPYVFVLDADNLVYPQGIRKLLEAIADDPAAAFSYGLIERFGGQGPVDLLNTQAWDVGLLAQRHYIDAMALVRVDAWREVGGYVTDPTLELGWEDYDLWLSFAGAGYHGVHVREIVGRYRVHGVSSLTITTLDTEDLMAKLHQRHSRFFQSLRARSE